MDVMASYLLEERVTHLNETIMHDNVRALNSRLDQKKKLLARGSA